MRHKIHLDFVSELNESVPKMLSMTGQDSQSFIKSYSDKFSELQGNFLSLLSQEL